MNRLHKFIRSAPRCRSYFTMLPAEPSLAVVPNRGLLRLMASKEQGEAFLNGLMSNHMPHPLPSGMYTSFLNAQGRVVYDCWVYPIDGGYIIEYDKRPTPALRAYLRPFVLKRRVSLREADQDWSVIQYWGSEETERRREWKWGPGGAVEPVITPAEYKNIWQKFPRAVDYRAPGMGIRVLVPKHVGTPKIWYTVVDSEQYTLRRMMQGIPEGSEEMGYREALPFEMNLDMMGGLDFRKGCYVGQELTVRTYHTGIIRKRTWPVALYRAGEERPTEWNLAPQERPLPPPQTPIIIPGMRGKGRLLSTHHNVGLAVLPWSAMDDLSVGETEYAVDWKDDPEWRVQPVRPSWWPVRFKAPSPSA